MVDRAKLKAEAERISRSISMLHYIDKWSREDRARLARLSARLAEINDVLYPTPEPKRARVRDKRTLENCLAEIKEHFKRRGRDAQ